MKRKPNASPKRIIASVMRTVSEELANTPAVTRSSYVHPLVVEAFEAEDLKRSELFGTPRTGLDPAETALMRFLEGALGAKTAEIVKQS
jgi:DNA topoisomerase-1